MATSQQQPPFYNDHFFFGGQSIHFKSCVNLSTMATLFCPQGGFCGEVQLYAFFSFRGGLRSGDIITKMNGKTTESSKQVYQHVHKGETLKIEVKRGEQYLNFTVQPEVVG